MIWMCLSWRLGYKATGWHVWVGPGTHHDDGICCIFFRNQTLSSILQAWMREKLLVWQGSWFLMLKLFTNQKTCLRKAPAQQVATWHAVDARWASEEFKTSSSDWWSLLWIEREQQTAAAHFNNFSTPFNYQSYWFNLIHLPIILILIGSSSLWSIESPKYLALESIRA